MVLPKSFPELEQRMRQDISLLQSLVGIIQPVALLSLRSKIIGYEIYDSAAHLLEWLDNATGEWNQRLKWCSKHEMYTLANELWRSLLIKRSLVEELQACLGESSEETSRFEDSDKLHEAFERVGVVLDELGEEGELDDAFDVAVKVEFGFGWG